MNDRERTALLEAEDKQLYYHTPYCEEEHELFISIVITDNSVIDAFTLCTQSFLNGI
jgi:hypothetical protein